MPNPPLQQTGRRQRRWTRHATYCGRQLSGRVVRQRVASFDSLSQIRRTMCLLALGCALLLGCADKPASSFEAAAVLCEGSWVASPDLRGPSPPPGYEQLRLAIATRPAGASGGVYAVGTVSWNGREWPMQCELSNRNGVMNPFCRYATGHPFTTSPDPEGISFVMLIGEGSLESHRSIDELYVDFDPQHGQPHQGIEAEMVRYVRNE